MVTISFNPVLPNYEYVPDVEPRLFQGRVYLYGSHDKFNGKSFCLNDYVCYSSAVDDLISWRYEGVIYRRNQDPKPGKGLVNRMFAPDVIQGLDGRYYLYYFIGFSSRISVAVCDEPAGQYQFLGTVKYQDGTPLGAKNEPLQFDPGIFIDDDQSIYLYTGFAPRSFPQIFSKGRKTTHEGAMIFKLEDDMLTIKSEVKFIAKTILNAQGTSFEGHAFFEASSMRKFNGKYYFIYSSYVGHELCYAISDHPDQDFEFGGVLVSNGDLGLSDKALNYTGNNHGSIIKINDQFYVTYHRHTNRHPFSRQVCVEPIMYDGVHFKQAEMTSMGFRGEPLPPSGMFDASICCHLTSKQGTFFYAKPYKQRKYWHPYLTQKGKDRNHIPNQYIAHIKDGTTIGYKYISPGSTAIRLSLSGCAMGNIIVSKDAAGTDLLGQTKLHQCFKTSWTDIELHHTDKIYAMYLQFRGIGTLHFHAFELITE